MPILCNVKMMTNPIMNCMYENDNLMENVHAKPEHKFIIDLNVRLGLPHAGEEAGHSLYKYDRLSVERQELDFQF
jgi:hypothetical protein